MQDETIRSTPPFPAGRFAGAGIVIVAGGPRYYTNAWVCLTVLRRVLGCRLPIQVWYLGPDEMSPRMIDLLRPFDVECVDALEVRRRHPARRLGGWESKSYASLHSPFKEVILLDADNVPLVDPTFLLGSAEYRATGAIFWPDLKRLGRERAIWQICRVPYRDEPEVESGQIVIDKERCWTALHLTRHLNEWSDFYYRYIQGDKETFHLAWRMLGLPYSMPLRPPWDVYGYIHPGDPNPANVLYQHDFRGRAIFQHRTGAKWIATGTNLRVPGFRHEDACLQALADLRGRWDGWVAAPPAAMGAPATDAEVLGSPRFLYCRVGSDQRELALLPDGRVAGNGGYERTWHLRRGPGGATLTIEGDRAATCALRRDADGVWRGRWLHWERMPVELIPLGPRPTAQSASAR